MKIWLTMLFYLPVVSALGMVPWEADRIFHFDMNWRTESHRGPKVTLFDAKAKGTARGRGLSPETFAVNSYPLYWIEKHLPTGASNQAVEWPAEGNVDAANGTMSLVVQGTNWDTSSSMRETLMVLDGQAGTLSLEKNKPDTLAVVLNGIPIIQAPFREPNRCHYLVVTWQTDPDAKTARVSLYDNRQLVGTAENVKLPTRYDRIVVGQLGPGPGTNKTIDDVSIYRRALQQGEITKAYYLDAKIALPKFVTIPRAARSPQIDGIFESGEWDNAAQIVGFVDEACDGYVYWYGTGIPWDVKDSIRLMYDDKYLYFAYHCPPPDKIKDNPPMIAAMLQSAKTGFDTNVDADDSLVIDIHRPYPYGDMYHFIVNGINTHYEFSDGGSAPGSVEKGRNLNFNPKWITASTLTLDGWRLEGAIPFADMHMPPPEPDGILHINFARWWHRTLVGLASWAHGARHGPNDTFYMVPTGQARFGASHDVTVQLHQLGNLKQGKLEFRGQVINPGDQPARIRVEFSSNSGEISSVQEMDVPASGRVPIRFDAQVTKPETGEVILRVYQAPDNRLIFASGHPLFRSDHPSVYFRKYPSWHLVKFETDFDSLSYVPAQEITVELEIKGITNLHATGFAAYRHTFEVVTSNVPPAQYEAIFRFSHRGKLLDTARYVFDIKPPPAWLNNTIGFDDPQRPPYPFTKMTLVHGQGVTVWGRIYRWGHSLLPEQIEINPSHSPPTSPTPSGMPLFRAPMRLVGDIDGTAFATDQLKAEYEWTEQLPTRIAGRRSVQVGNLRIMAEVETEYDGFTWVKLTLIPTAGPLQIRSLQLEQRYTPEFTDVVNAGEYSLEGTGAFPTNTFFKSAILPIWVGNGEGGLQTFVETLATWHVHDLQTTLQLLREPAGGIMRYNIIDKPLVLTRPRTIEFGWNATPTRIKEWRTYREQTLAHRTSYFSWYTTPEWHVGDLGWTNLYFNGAMIVAREDTKSWHRAQPYLNIDQVPIIDPDVQEFGDEWLQNPEERWRDRIGKEAETIAVTFASKTFRDWVLHRMNELFQRAPFAGWYYDVVSARPCANPYAGAGVLLEDGTLAPASPLRGLREVTKRLYVLCRRYYPDGQAMIHSSGMPNMAYMAFCEVFFDGENLNSLINDRQQTYRGVLTPERFRAEYMGHNFGPQLWWLGQSRIPAEFAQKHGPENLVDHVAGLMLLHDVPIIFAGGFGLGGCDHAAVRHERAIQRYELYGLAYQFIPYWRQKAATGLRDRQFVSWYIRRPVQPHPHHWALFTAHDVDASLPHRAIGIFCNESDWRGEMVVKLDLQQLGFKQGVEIKAINAVHSTGFRMNGNQPEYPPNPAETATLIGNELRFPMTEWNYRMIVLEEDR